MRERSREPLFRNGYALVFSTGATGLLGIIFWAVAARRFSPAVIGENAALVAAMQTISTFAQLDLASIMMRFLPEWRDRAARAVKLSYLISTGMTIVLAAGFVLIASRFENWEFLRNAGLALAFGVAVIGWGVFAIQDGVLIGLQRAVVVPFENVSFSVAKIALLFLLPSAILHWTVFVAWSIPVLVALIPINLLIFRRYMPAHRTRPVKTTAASTRLTITRYIAIDYLTGLCGAISMMTLPLLVLSIVGAKASGEFYIAWTVIVIFDTITLNLGSSLVVEGAYDPTRLVEYGRKTVARSLVLLVPVVGSIMVFASLILQVFGRTYSSGATTVLRILALGLIPRALVGVWASVARVERRVERILAVVSVATFVTVVLVAVLGLRFGLPGVAWGWTAGNYVGVLLVLPELRRKLQHRKSLHSPSLVPNESG